MWDAGGFHTLFSPSPPTSWPQTFWIKHSMAWKINWSPSLMRVGLFSASDSFVAGKKSRHLIKAQIVRDWGLVPAPRRIKASNRVSGNAESENGGLRCSHRKPGQDLDTEMKMNTSFLSLCAAVKSQVLCTVYSSVSSTPAHVSELVSGVHLRKPLSFIYLFFLLVLTVSLGINCLRWKHPCGQFLFSLVIQT